MRDTKATAVLALGVVAVITGPLLGGIVPAVVALQLARQARAEIIGAGGFLTGGRRLRTGMSLAWAGITLAAAASVLGVIFGLLGMTGLSGGTDFGPGVD